MRHLCLLLATAAALASAAHRHRSLPLSSSWDVVEDDRDEDAPPRHHHLRHRHHGGSKLDQLLNRLETVSVDAWQRRDGDRGAPRDMSPVREELRKAVEEYERAGDPPAAAVRKGGPEPPLPRSAALTAPDQDDEEDDVADDDDVDNDDDDDDLWAEKHPKERDEEDETEDSESEEVDKNLAVGARANYQWAEPLTVNYRSSESQELLGDSPGSLSAHKWDAYGNRKNLEHTRRNGVSAGYKKAETLYKKTTEHIRLMSKPGPGSCKVPKPMVINVQHVYPDTSKIYVPRCTLIHQCSDATGCCASEQFTCKAKSAHKIELPFHVKIVGFNEFRVETLYFYNATECECVEREDMKYGGSSAPALGYTTPRKQRETRDQNIPTSRHEKPRCKCPSAFTPRQLSQNRCTCDCFDRQEECLKYKKGLAYFGFHDKLCIQSEQCRLPECEYGEFLKLSARCARKDEWIRSAHWRQ